MESIDLEVNEAEFRNAPTPPLPPTPEEQVSFTEEEVLAGKPTIPLKDTFEFLLQYVATQYEKKMGISTPVDRNFFFFQEHASRKQMSKIKRYTFLFPMLVDAENRKALLAIQPYTELLRSDGTPFEKDAFLVHYLTPSEEHINSELPLITLNHFFQSEIRDREYEKGGLTLAHILASIISCLDDGFPHFSIQEGDNTSEDPKRTRWSFQVLKEEDKVKLFIYRIVYAPPVDGIHESVLSPWISHTNPTYQRETKSAKCFIFSEDDIGSIREDKDVKELLQKSKEENNTK